MPLIKHKYVSQYHRFLWILRGFTIHFTEFILDSYDSIFAKIFELLNLNSSCFLGNIHRKIMSFKYIAKKYCIAKVLPYRSSVTWARVMAERSPPPPLELCSLAGLGCQLVTLSSKIGDLRLGPESGQSSERDDNTICFQFVLLILLSYLLRYTA